MSTKAAPKAVPALEVDELTVALGRRGQNAIRKLRELQVQADEIKVAKEKYEAIVKEEIGDIPLGRKVFATVGGLKVFYSKSFIRRNLNSTLLRKSVDEETIASCTTEVLVQESKLVIQK